VLHLASIALLYTAFLQSDYLEFLGLKQAYRGILGILGKVSPISDIKLFGSDRLEVRRQSTYRRYTWRCRRMIKIFEDDYRRYQRRVGAYFPLFWRRLET